MPKWTNEQELAIYESGKNIIVSAGAGSGKTAVLSERVLKKIESGISINELLVLTFTKAAASEMKDRIRNKIKKNPNLSDEVNKLEASYITTFDSYSLSIVKKYHYLLNISPNVNIIDASLLNIKVDNILSDIMEEMYQSNDDNFINLIDSFCIKDDSLIVNSIKRINSKLNMLYDKEKYLNDYLNKMYDINYVNNAVKKYIEYCFSIVKYVDVLVNKLSEYVDCDYLDSILEVLNPLLNSTKYEDLRVVNSIKLPNLKKGTEEDGKLIKKEISETLKEIIDLVVYDNEEEIVKTIYLTKPYVTAIIDIIRKLDKRVNEFKFNNDLYDFNDISKLAIRIIKDNRDICNNIKNQFKEILVDEYQDTNDLQEMFISSISNNNLYMVGDIKQSIYRFRNANPTIFRDKYDKYSKNNGGFKIDLLKNFRSRSEVLNNINLVFDLIMDFDIGGANYQESHEMVFGNTAYLEDGNNQINNDFEIYNYEYDKESGYKKEEIEAFIIAEDIKNKVNNHYQVFDKDGGKLRDITYNDFVILMDRSTNFDLYKKIFLYKGISLNVYKDEYLTNSDELLVIKNIFKLLSLVKKRIFNKEFTYSFLSIGRSFLFDYDDNYLFSIIKNNSYYQTDILKKIVNISSNLESNSITNILDLILQEFDFYNKFLTIGSVKDSMVNINYLYDLSSSLNKMGYTYLDFLDFLEVVIANKMDIKFSLNNNVPNSVKIMTIHKSKGLEFPICYFSGLTVKFNESDIKDQFIYDNQLGIITPYFKEGTGNTIYKQLFKNNYITDEVSEKIRLFYVAMTRAREKMIFVLPFEDKNEEYDNGVVNNNIRLSYNSFSAILSSIKSKLVNYCKNIDLSKVFLSKQYNMITSSNVFDNLNSHCEKVKVIEYPHYEPKLIDKHHFSKNISLIDQEVDKNLKFGIRMHYLLELLHLSGDNIEQLTNDFNERNYLNNFLNCGLLKNVKNAKVYKEYEFIVQNDSELSQGIIDLMLEYDDHIDIIDYKLNNIDDKNYQKQLNGYKNYIVNKTNKEVKLYLYSILKNKYQEIE